jgi:ATP-dependent Lhr-like helicase
VERNGALDVLAQHVMGVACGDPFQTDALYAEVRTAAPYAELTREDFDTVVEFVSTGGYSLKIYDRFRRIVQGKDGLWRARNALAAQRHRMNVGAIHAASTLNIRVSIGRGRGGRKIGEAEEFFFEQITVGDTFLFSGQVWKFEGVVGVDALVSPAKDAEPRILSWGGSKFALSTYLAGRVRRMIADEDSWIRLPADVQEWLHAQKARSMIPREDELLIETYPRGKRFYMVCYPFEGGWRTRPWPCCWRGGWTGRAWGRWAMSATTMRWRSGPCGLSTRSTWTSCSSRTCWATTSRRGWTKAI